MQPADLFGTIPQEPWNPGKRAKPDQVIQLNCREVHIAMDLMVLKYRFAKEIYIKQINDIQKWTTEFGRKRSCLKRIIGYDTGVGGGGGGGERWK